MKIPKYKLVFDRRHTAAPNKKGSIEFVVTYNYKQKFVSTGLQVFPNQWNAKLCNVMKCEDALQKNEMLRAFLNKAETILTDMVKKEKVDLDLFMRLMLNKNDLTNITFFEYVRSRAKEKAVRESTRKRYGCFLNILEEFRPVICFDEINVKFIRTYDEWLHKRNIGTEEEPRMMMQSSIATHHKYMKQFINDAIVDGLMDKNPYGDRAIKIDRGGRDHVDYITDKQLKKLMKLQLETPYLIKARDLFVLQAYTGLSYSDLMEFDFKKIVNTEGGNAMMYIGHRKKTGVEFIIFLLPEARAVLAKYHNQVPQISNQKYNLYLKTIGDMIGVPGLHSHQARGTFATLALNRGMNIDILKKVLGHTKALQTSHYASVLQDTVAREMEKLR